MMQVTPRWKVVVTLTPYSQIILWISDPFLSNVLRQVASMQFTEEWLKQPVEITVSAVEEMGNALAADSHRA